MKLENIKLIALDLDGTLLDSFKNLSTCNIKALENIKKKGVFISYASGRSLKSMQSVIDKFNPNGPLITYNGVKIYDQNRNILYHQLLSENDGIEVIKYCLKSNLTMIIWSNELLYCTKTNSNITKYASVSGLVPIVLGFDLMNYNIVLNQGIDKILIYEDHHLLLKVKDDLNNLTETSVEFSSPYYLEFFNKKASKGEGVKKVCEFLNVSLDNTMAFGDQFNDASMLDVVKYPIVMGNSVEELKIKYKNVTLSNDENGVAFIINKIIN